MGIYLHPSDAAKAFRTQRRNLNEIVFGRFDREWEWCFRVVSKIDCNLFAEVVDDLQVEIHRRIHDDGWRRQRK